jgi:hypothetical protein
VIPGMLGEKPVRTRFSVRGLNPTSPEELAGPVSLRFTEPEIFI